MVNCSSRGGGDAGGGACFIDGMMACLISGEEAEIRDLGEVLLEKGSAVVEFASLVAGGGAGLPFTLELWREAGV